MTPSDCTFVGWSFTTAMLPGNDGWSNLNSNVVLIAGRLVRDRMPLASTV